MLLVGGLGMTTNALCGVGCVVCAPVPAAALSFPPISGMCADFCRFFFFYFFCHAPFSKIYRRVLSVINIVISTIFGFETNPKFGFEIEIGFGSEI